MGSTYGATCALSREAEEECSIPPGSSSHLVRLDGLTKEDKLLGHDAVLNRYPDDTLRMTGPPSL